MQLIRSRQVKHTEDDYDGLPTTRSKLVLPYTDTDIIPNGIREEKIRLEIFSVVFEFVYGEIKVGIRNLTPDTEFFITAGCSTGLLPQGLGIRIKWKLLYILKEW